MQAPVAATAAALASAQRTLVHVRSPWLLAAVASPLADFNRQVDDALPQAQLASAALQDAPGLLGAQGDRSYLILFTNPAESRFLGGFTGSFGILSAHQGKVSFTVGDRISNLFPGPKRLQLAVSGEAEFVRRYSRYDPAHNLQNLTVSPDLPTDATVTRSLFKQYYGTSLDGIVVVDPYALAALLKLTGPVQVEGLGQPLTADNAARYLVYQQYVTYGNAKDDRKDILSAAGRATFKALTTRDLPGPAAVGQALGPVVAQGRLLFYPFDAHDQPLFARIGTLGRFAPAHVGGLPLRSLGQRQRQQDRFAADARHRLPGDLRPGQGHHRGHRHHHHPQRLAARGVARVPDRQPRRPQQRRQGAGRHQQHVPLVLLAPGALVGHAQRRAGGRGVPDREGGQGLLDQHPGGSGNSPRCWCCTWRARSRPARPTGCRS